MIEFNCPRCLQEFKVPDENVGRRARCTRCGGDLVVPVAAPPIDVPSVDVPSVAAPSSAVARGKGGWIDVDALGSEEPRREQAPVAKNAQARDAKKLSGPFSEPSWFWGIVVPLIVVVVAILLGFVKQDIEVGGSLRSGPGFRAQGPAAVWAGVSSLGMALVLHMGFYWMPRKRFKDRAIWAGLLGLVVFFVGLFLAAVKQDDVLEERQRQWQQLKEQAEDIGRNLEQRKPANPFDAEPGQPPE